MKIDESKFGKRKYHRSHQVEGAWVFGGIEGGAGRIFIVVVENRSAETLLQCIEVYRKRYHNIFGLLERIFPVASTSELCTFAGEPLDYL